MALQTIVSRNMDSAEAAVVTVGTFQAGTATNVISDRAELTLSIRSFSPQVRDLIRERVHTVVQTQAACWDTVADIEYDSGHPVLTNSVQETEFAILVAEELVGSGNVPVCPLIPGSEDFSFYLQHKPGCLLRLGNGEGSESLHNPRYDFHDGSLTTGAALWSRLAERFLN